MARTVYADHSFFDSIDSEAKAYWLGFFTADGYVYRSERLCRIELSLGIEDIDHVEKFRDALQSNASVRVIKNGTMCSLHLTSWQLVPALERLGITKRKAFTVRPWQGPPELMRHYWRGIFDGDGSIGVTPGGQYGYWRLSAAGNEAMMRALASFCETIVETVQKVRKHPTKDSWAYQVTGRPVCRPLALALYGDATVYLARKHRLALQLLGTPEDETSRWWNPEKSYQHSLKTPSRSTPGQLPLRLPD